VASASEENESINGWLSINQRHQSSWRWQRKRQLAKLSWRILSAALAASA
jgi:hypothetical protein